jgi:1,4-dihydroxy-2-naphthoyl-CoA hydrolase
VTTEPTLPIAPHETLGGVLGIEHLEMGAERATAWLDVASRHKQPFGLVHGGTYAAMAEGLASDATFRAVAPEGMLAQGMSHNLNFLRPVFSGGIHAEAIRRHRGRTTWVWDVDITDDDGRLVATSRVAIAVRPMPDELKAQLGIA